MTPDLATVQAFAARYTAAWCSQDPDRVAGFYSPNGTLTINGAPPAVGRAAIAASARSFMVAFPDLVVRCDNVTARGDRWHYDWTLEGTNAGPGGTRARVLIRGREDWRLGPDGLVAESIGTFDEADYQRQLAAGPAA